jgi:hypothetical protein
MKQLTSLLIAVFLFIGGITPVKAADDGGALRLITSPLPVTLTAKPGQSVSTELRIRNGGTHDETLKMGLMTFKAYGNSGSPKLLERQPGDDFFDWVKFSQPQFSIAPNQWKTITMTISVPTSAAFGYYYAATFTRANPVSLSGQTTEAALIGSTATLVLLDVDVPGAKREVKVISFTTDKPWYEFLPTTFTVTLRNTGNVHVAPRGNIFIGKSAANDDAVLEINPARGNILPDSIRTFTTAWTDGFPVYVEQQANGKVVEKDGQQQMKLQWHFSDADKLRFGKYTAHLAMVYDDGHKDIPLEATATFWVIPWRIILALLLNALIIIGFFSLIIVWLIRRRHRSH